MNTAALFFNAIHQGGDKACRRGAVHSVVVEENGHIT